MVFLGKDVDAEDNVLILDTLKRGEYPPPKRRVLHALKPTVQS